MIPAFSAALQQIVSNPAAIAGILKELASGDHAASYAPGQAPAPGAAGGDALGQIFGSPQAVETVVQHVSQVSGVSPDIVRTMLPAVASMLIGGLAHAMASLGLSGVLSQLADAMSAPGAAGQAAAPAPGSSGGVFGSLISMFGGGHATANPETAALAAGLCDLERNVRLRRAGRPGASGGRERDRPVVHPAAARDRRLRANVPSLLCRRRRDYLAGSPVRRPLG